jgi:hypothetical protein
MTVPAMTSAEKLQVPVLDYPHWRVNFRPATYLPKRLGTLSECVEVLNRTRVQLRGWDFPHLPASDSAFDYGDTWVAASSDFMNHYEYWRFFQSTQFLYLGSVREVTETEWNARIRSAMQWHSRGKVDIDRVPGFLNTTECIFNLTEYFEFAARLAQAQVYVEPLTIAISIKGISGFMLAEEPNRRWNADFVTRQEQLNFEDTFAPADLISSAADYALNWAVQLFERFGWLKPNLDSIRTDQQKLLTRKF